MTKFFFLVVTFSLVLGMGGTPSWAAGKKKASGKAILARYPRVEYLLGKAFLVSDVLTVEKRAAQVHERERLLKKGEILKDKARLRTGEASEIELQLSESARLTILENSEINIPGISWDRGVIFQIQMISGKVRVRCDQDCNRTFINPLFEAILPAGDFVWSYDPRKPMVGLQVLKGETSFRGFGNETELHLKEGEMATFTGVVQGEGEIAFDVLLKGRKVAQGQTSPVQKIPPEEWQLWKARDEAVKRKLKKAAEALIVKRTPQQICERPLGELGQCSWKCERNPKKATDCAVQSGAVCVRTRCMANGIWSDRTELSANQSRCGIKVLVNSCDY